MKLVLLISFLCFAARVRAAEEDANRRNLLRIRVISADPAPWLLPLGLCTGDCDSDNDVSNGNTAKRLRLQRKWNLTESHLLRFSVLMG